MPRLGLGTLRLAGFNGYGPPPNRARAREVLMRAVELGVRLIDTADAYGPDVVEELIADSLRPYPDDLVIATKGGQTRPSRLTWRPDGDPAHLRRACEASLRRLVLERIDLYQLHTFDSAVPFEETVGALAALRDEGKIRHVGLSNVPVEQLRRAQAIVPIVSVQNRLNLVDREDSVVDYCADHGIAYLCWFPLGRGDLVRPNRRIEAVARKHEATIAQVALAWLLARSVVTLPIPGTASPAHVEENMQALELRLDADDLESLEGVELEGRAALRRRARAAARRALHSTRHAAERLRSGKS